MERSYDDELRERNFGDLFYETPHWLVFLAPNQSNIGTCVVALKRHDGVLARLSEKEWVDFGKTVNILESALKKSFSPTLFNWGALMNADYMKENPDPHIHWHFIPRYKNKVEFDGLVFVDKYFGSMQPRPIEEVPASVRKKIIEKIKEKIEI
ncbi:HIT family protein [Methanobacterium sp. ACI-7]|uniref:HIT family protein n=1 Tax=unclassified Methanobacterium TaxID=2627676 RepID=UPI0039C2B700